MRIYLDSNVFRALKKPENSALYDLVLKDRDRNYYYFSEAHIQDLVQDDSDKKLLDMDFMESIVQDNCWHYDKSLKVQFRRPRDYYGDYNWKIDTGLMSSEDTSYVLLRESFRAIPLNLTSFFNAGELPPDFPEDLKPMLLESVSMLDFMATMLDLTENLSSEQPRFKRLLQYLHRSFGDAVIYEKLGIMGYDGKDVIDWVAFSESLNKLVYQRSHDKELYGQFTEMQFTLEIYGIIKGKPKKQKFMSLLNDGKHAYYAGYAHLLVTSDADMIAKAKLVYKVFGIATEVITPEDLCQYLQSSLLKDNSIKALFEQFELADTLPTVYENYSLNEIFIKKDLPIWYLGEFNTLNCVSARGITYFYFSQDFQKITSNTLVVELERVVNILSDHFGNDALGQSKFDRRELEHENWKGREWRVGEMGVLFQAKQGMTISFFKAASPAEKHDNASEGS